MTPSDLREWRQRMGWTQRQAAEALGVSLRWFQALEWGVTVHQKYPIRTIDRRTALACNALEHGLDEWRTSASGRQ